MARDYIFVANHNTGIMEFVRTSSPGKRDQVWLVSDLNDLKEVKELPDSAKKFVKEDLKDERSISWVYVSGRWIFVYLIRESQASEAEQAEKIRKDGARLQAMIQEKGIRDIFIKSWGENPVWPYVMAEGIAMANYQFRVYRSKPQGEHHLKKIALDSKSVTAADCQKLAVTIGALYQARDLVNYPANYLTATQLGKEVQRMGKEAGFKVTVLTEKKIQSENMGGLLAVNQGSQDPPAFIVAEHKPKNPKNKKPIVLVGKGIVYDTGGLSLKPTPQSMDRMKSDMSGAAIVSAALYALAKLNAPLHVIVLIPATDNRIGQKAYSPGDIIRMYAGTTVEVLNTDAEGRLVLADALHWAKRYQPELVIDFATLTGAASVAIGEFAMVSMGTAPEEVHEQLSQAGFRQHERMVRFPLWAEYGELIQSEIADLKNIGGPKAGAITAGKFLEHFTDYPWVHFDIAGTSFANSRKGYIAAGGTGFGLRMILDFFSHYSSTTES